MPGLLRGVARTAVIAGTATTVSNRVSRRQGERWAQQEASQAAPAPQAPPPAPEAGGQSTIDNTNRQQLIIRDSGPERGYGRSRTGSVFSWLRKPDSTNFGRPSMAMSG